MKIVVAVSGGVDSVVLLDLLVRSAKYELIVAHFDHGMRADSAADARFVEGLGQMYGLPVESKREDLSGQSEELARERRYGFLFEVASRHEARLVTAHHRDDLVETIAMNFQRGSRWRGLATMSDNRIWRPLLKRTKSELTNYALEKGLEWCEDETNQQTVYTRNRLRKKLASLPASSAERLYNLWHEQSRLRWEIENEIEQRGFPVLSRYFLTMLDESTAKELLYDYVWRECGVSLLGAQLDRLWMAIKTGRPNTTWQISQGLEVRLLAKDWRVYSSEK